MLLLLLLLLLQLLLLLLLLQLLLLLLLLQLLLLLPLLPPKLLLLQLLLVLGILSQCKPDAAHLAALAENCSAAAAGDMSDPAAAIAAVGSCWPTAVLADVVGSCCCLSCLVAGEASSTVCFAIALLAVLKKHFLHISCTSLQLTMG